MDNNNVIERNIKRQVKFISNLNWQIEQEVKTILEKPNLYKKDLIGLEDLLIDLEITKLRLSKDVNILKRTLN